MVLEFNMVQTIALAVVMLLIGKYLVNRVKVLNTYCIPAPVVGGLLFAILALILRQADIVNFELDTTLQSIAMTMFFASVGFSASLAILKKGGVQVILFLALAVVLVVLQNVLGIGLAKVLDVDPMIGLATGSMSMTGGHGTSGAFGQLIENAGVASGTSIAIAAATFGLVGGSIIGGPVGKRLIEKNSLEPNKDNSDINNIELAEEKNTINEDNLFTAVYMIFIAMGIGTLVSSFLENATGLTFPPYIGAMLVGAVMRNLSDGPKLFEVPIKEIGVVGEIGLSLFLSMALISLKLWELLDLAGPMIILLLAQLLLMFLYSRFITFNIMGKDYDAAVLSAGHCGFGMGATANGVANMTSVTDHFGPSPTAFFVLPLVGSLFIDFINTGIITFFMNIL